MAEIPEMIERVLPVDLVREMKKSYIDYAMSVIVGRALPDARDGLKPVHRRILYTMNEAGFTPDKPHRKCATTVGDVLGKYHPHGDMSVYDALVRMAQDFSLRYPMVDGHGNFGSVDGDPPAAYRYTEARLAKLATQMLTEIDKETVDFVPNYDDRLKEPSVLPARFPSLLVNGSAGIAVGMATNMPPHNLRECVNGLIALIDNPEIDADGLMEHIKGPDFPTYGQILGRAGIRAAYHTGRGKVMMRAKAEIQEDKSGKTKIVVTELPYQVNKVKLQEKVAELIKEGRLSGISAMDDFSDRDGMHLEFVIKRDANANVVLNNLYKLTQMQESFSIINLALVNNQPKVLTLKELLVEYLNFQKEIITRRTIFDKKKAEARAHILEGYRIALDHLDEVIRIIRESYDNAKQNLMAKFGFSEIQAQAILDMQLKRLQGLEREKIDNEYNELMALIAYLNEVLENEQLVLDIIKKESLEIAEKYGDDRRTEILANVNEIDDEDLIPETDCVLTITNIGYLKRTPADVYKAQKRGGRGISGMQTREEDYAEGMTICNSHDDVLFFTNFGRTYRIKAYEIGETSRNSRGTAAVNIIPLMAEEKITALIPIPKGIEHDKKFLNMITAKGTIKRTALSKYIDARKNGVRGIVLEEGDELITVELTDGNQDIIIATKNGQSIRFNEAQVRPTAGRVSRGVRGIRLRAGDVVVGAIVAEKNSDEQLLVASERGYGKQTPISAYRTQSRGGIGTKTYKITEKTGKVAKIIKTTDEDDLLVITNQGVIIRMNAEDIRSTVGKVSSGVRLVKLPDDAMLVGIETIARENDEGKTEENNNA